MVMVTLSGAKTKSAVVVQLKRSLTMWKAENVQVGRKCSQTYFWSNADLNGNSIVIFPFTAAVTKSPMDWREPDQSNLGMKLGQGK